MQPDICTCNNQLQPHGLIHEVCPHDRKGCWTCTPITAEEVGVDDPWWVGRQDRDQLTGAYIPGTERRDPLTGRWS